MTAQANLEFVTALRRNLIDRDIYNVVVLTEREAEELYQIVLNWGLAIPRYRPEAIQAIELLGFDPPREWLPDATKESAR